MKVLFACGGTAGHINPALAVATELRRRVPDCEILFVGNPGGMEATLVPRAGFRFAPYRSMGIQRRFSWNNIKYNAKSVCLLVTARSRISDSHSSSQKGMPWAAQRFSTRSGAALSTSTVTCPRR